MTIKLTIIADIPGSSDRKIRVVPQMLKDGEWIDENPLNEFDLTKKSSQGAIYVWDTRRVVLREVPE